MATPNNLLSIVQWIFRQINRNPPTSLSSANNFTQTIIDSVNEAQRNVGEIAKSEQWNIVHASDTFPSVASQRQYTITPTAGDLDPAIPLRRLVETTTPYDLDEANEEQWKVRTRTVTTGTPQMYRVTGTAITSLARSLIIELDPLPTAVITYTYEYFREFPDLSLDADVSHIPEGLLKYGGLVSHLRHKGRDMQYELGLFTELLTREREKQSQNNQRMVYGREPVQRVGVGFPPNFGFFGDE